MGEACRTLAPARVVELLYELIRGARLHPGPPWQAALAAVAATLGDEALLSYEVRAALYASAKEHGRQEVARLFLAAAPLVGEPEAPDPEVALLPAAAARPAEAARGAPRSGADLRGRTLTLGERKSLARGGRRDLLVHLLRDPDAAVIRVLLGNPKLTEADVVRVAARRPVRQDVLLAVFKSRWLSRYAVRKALVMNPYTPTDVAVGLVATLEEPDLRQAAGDPQLAEPVRAQAAAILAARKDA